MNTVQKLLCAVAFAGLAACSQKEAAGPAAAPASAAAKRPAGVDIPPQAAIAADIETATAGPARIAVAVTLHGHIQADPEHLRAVTARYPGVVRAVVHKVGDRVAAGAALATVESNESLQVYTVRAPIAGIVTERRTNPGQVAGTEPIFEIGDLSTVRAEMSVFPRDRARLKVGQRVRIAANDGAILADSTISFVAPLGDMQNQSIVARASLANRDGRWTPGQFITAQVYVDDATVPVAVTAAALQTIKQRPVIFVQTAGRFAVRHVEIGRRGSDFVEITKGLAAGERYVSRNSFVVKSEVLRHAAEE